ncbi:sensor histidine kinase [Streptomyces sp. NBC_01244]|uniref:sensor histidine kinase n=1 Tax=Streptomyces sp. NBC_01244 TaxID=2903797 RepID=UPI002E1194A8|nr:histidine kinase [Streptomyces sp. NBC_01244]
MTRPSAPFTIPRLQLLAQIADVVYALGSLGISAAMLHNWPDPNGYWRDNDLWSYGLLCAVYLPLAVRRRFPVPVLVWVALCDVVYLSLAHYPAVTVCGLGLACYTVASRRVRTVSVPAAVVTWLVLLWGTRLLEPGIGGLGVAFVTSTAAVTWVTGDVSRRFAERGERLAALTRQLRDEQEERTRRAVTDECMRIARELHDVIAHHVSVISIQAGVADYVFTSDPPAARQALHTAADSAREAGDEMRRMLTVLRHGTERAGSRPGEDDVQPRGLAALPPLIERVNAAGVAVRVVGEVPTRLPAGIDMCVYRIVQEALTNVLKHAHHAAVEMTFRHDTSGLSVRITDDGTGQSLPAQRDFPGHGLMGMRERATIYGGSVAAGPRPQGGYQVDLTLPIPNHQ